MAPQTGYMHIESIATLYKNLKRNSLEIDVDRLWNNILYLYFDPRNRYTIGPQQRPESSAKTQADFIITAVRNGLEKKICLIEDKRVKDEGSSAVWEDAVEQVTGYMKVARMANFDEFNEVETMYAIVTVGHYSRFYEFWEGEQYLRDYPGTGGRAFEFKKDEETIDGILLDIVRKTEH